MTTFANYRRYKKLKLRNAALLAGIDHVLIPFAKGVGIAALALIGYAAVSSSVEAGQRATDNRVAAELAQQAVLLKAMGDVISKCTSPGENFITVDDELWACGATRTGIKVRP